MKRSTKIVLIVILCVACAIAVGGIYAYSFFSTLDEAAASSESGTESDIIDFTVESGMTTSDIAQALEDDGVIKSAFKFKVFSRRSGYDGTYQAGTYALSPAMKLSEIAEILSEGKVNTISFTVVEGMTVNDIAELLSDKGLVSSDEFRKLLTDGGYENDYDFLATVSQEAIDAGNRFEGYFFPATYEVYKGVTGDQIIRMMLDRFEQAYTDEMKARADELGLTTNEVVTIASIIEKEAPLDSDRPLVASVIYNRLDAGMTLGMTSTVNYLLNKYEELTTDDLATESPYNTYINYGLPAGPICSPSDTALNAALYPAETDYLYFVLSAKGDGSNAFSSDYEQFLEDTQAYYDSIDG
ncbi:MAG: endolytic transglycosylase MltG [Eubacterium sp.]|jgi:UPF0755 protein